MRITWFQILQVVLGISTSGPLAFLAVESLYNGDILFAATLGGFGVIGFFLPGWILQQLLLQLSTKLSRVKYRITVFVAAPLPDVIYSPEAPDEDTTQSRESKQD